MTTSSQLVFRHFIPKEDDLRHFVDITTSRADDVIKKLETEMNEAVKAARHVLETSVSKNTLDPNWDLKREFKNRNKQLDILTLSAIHKIASGQNIIREKVSGEMVSALERTDEPLLDEHNLSESESENEWDTREMNHLSKKDILPNE